MEESRLNRNQANALFRFKQDVLKDLFRLETDKVEAGSAIMSLYRRILPEYGEPKLYFAEGPSEAAELLNSLLGKPGSNTGDSSKFGIHAKSSSVRPKLDSFVFNFLKQKKAKLKSALPKPVFRETLNILFRDLNFQVCHSVFYQVERSLPKLTGSSSFIPEFHPHPSFADWDWITFHKGCEHVFGIPAEIPDDISRLLSSGFYTGYFYDKFCILITFPQVLRKNENLVLHDEDGPAIAWGDGTSLCFWNGIHVPEKLICAPETVTAADILSETNAEVRRCYQEKLGSEQFGKLLGLVELDRKSDRFGNESILFRTKLRDKLAGDFIYFAKVICPSTGRSYFLCVPPWMKGVDQAVSWTFGKTPDDYKPFLET